MPRSSYFLNSCNFYHSVNQNLLLFGIENYFSKFYRDLYQKKSQSPSPRPKAHRAAAISVSITLGHASANAMEATAGGWSTVSSASLTFPLHSHMSGARREGSEYHF